MLAGDYNVIPNDDDTFSVRAMASDALMYPESRQRYRSLLTQGWTDALRTRFPSGGIWTFWDYQAGCWQRDAGFRLHHLLLAHDLPTGWRARASTRIIAAANAPAITPRPG